MENLYNAIINAYEQLKYEYQNIKVSKKVYKSSDIDLEIEQEEKQRIDLIKKILVIQEIFKEKVHSYLDKDLLTSLDIDALKEIFKSYEVTDEQIFQKMFKN
jgi:hypothetical protein